MVAGAYSRAGGQMFPYPEASSSSKFPTGFSGSHAGTAALPRQDLGRSGLCVGNHNFVFEELGRRQAYYSKTVG